MLFIYDRYYFFSRIKQISKGEEVNNPKRNIPLSIFITLFVVSICYCSVSVVLTLMIPYYIINPEIPLPQGKINKNLELQRIDIK